jgi:type I restriction enzyme, S subunit
MYEFIGAEDWSNISLYDVANWKNGLAFKNIDFSQSGLPVIKITELKNGITEQTKFTDSKYSEDVFIKRGDMVFAWSGSPQTSIDTFRWGGVNGWLNQHIFKVTPHDFISDQFLFFLLKSLRSRFVQIALNKQTTGLGHVTVADLKEMRVGIPNLSEQRSIVNIIAPLHEKIENNRRMNETLEEMARAIFKSWFVDFDPVHAKAAGNAPAHMDADTAALFPSSFGDDGLPVGWGNKELGSLAQILNGYAFKSSDYVKEGLFVLRTKNFSDARSAERLADDVYLPEKFAEDYQKYLCEPFDFHVVMVAASLGKTSYIFPHMLPALRNQNMWCFRPVKAFPYRFFLNLSIEDKITHVIGWGSGSARDFFKKADFVKHQITICENSILDQFEKTAASLYEKIAANHHQNETLAELRDTLLPKLMSGEIRVADAEREVEAAL